MSTAVNNLLSAWGSMFKTEEQTLALATLVDQGVWDIEAMVANDPAAPWLLSAAVSAVVNLRSEKYFRDDKDTIHHSSRWQQATQGMLARTLTAGATPWATSGIALDAPNHLSVSLRAKRYALLPYLASMGWSQMLADLLERPDAPSPEELAPVAGTLLLNAMKNPTLDSLDVLLRHGLSPEAKVEGNPLLSYATTPAQAQCLVQHGASWTSKTKGGLSIIEYWHQKLPHRDLSAMKAWWVKHQGVPTSLAARFDQIQGFLPLDSLRRFNSTLQIAGIHGDEVDESGRTLVDVLVYHASRQPVLDTAVLKSVIQKTRPLAKSHPSSIKTLALLAYEHSEPALGASLLRASGVDFEDPKTWPSSKALAKIPNGSLAVQLIC